MILNVEVNSKMATAGLQSGDVILQVIDTSFGGTDKIVSVNDLQASYQSRKWRGVLEVVVSRNQTQRNIAIDLLD